MNAGTRWMLLAMGVFVLASVPGISAQVETKKTVTEQPSTQEVQVENAEVLHVTGHDLVLKMSDGSIRHISNVPDSARATVDGKEIGIQDVKPGMKLQRTVVTTTTPKVVTTVETVQGRVWQVRPPNSVILRLEDGNHEFEIPEGQRFMVDGKETDVFGLKKGMMVSATKIVEEPQTTIEQQSKVTGQMPPPPAAPSATLPILVAKVSTTPPTLAEEAKNEPPKAEKELPQTGSELPLLLLVGSLSLIGAARLRFSRKM